MAGLRLVSITDPERDSRVRRVFKDGLIPVQEEVILAVTPHQVDPEPCWLVDLDRLSDEQRTAISEQYSTPFGMTVEEAVDELAEHGMPIPVVNTIMIAMEGAA